MEPSALVKENAKASCARFQPKYRSSTGNQAAMP